ncbi:hypothetical protein SO694_00011044 [Aureococcus anophagefferens]|uniref:Protein kinase domain-containing protein n=1 Tax=Aureococcus anophagefferens TaxID=44056 RepID=A0ABR1GEQ4_AURAN
MAPSRGPFKPPKVTSSIEFEAMLENMTESSSDDDEDISLHSTPKPGDSLSPRTTEAVFSHLLQEQDDEASSSAAFSPPDHGSIPLESRAAYFMAPEIMANAPYAPAADVWSFGGVVLQMATGHFPGSRRTTRPAKIERIAKESDAPRPARSRSAPGGQDKQPNPYRRAKSDAAKAEKHRSRNPYAKKRAPGAIRVDGADEAKRAEPSPYGRSSASDAASVATTLGTLDATLKGARPPPSRPLDELAPSTPSTLATPSPVDDGSSRRAVFKMPSVAEDDGRDGPARPRLPRYQRRPLPRTAPPVPYRGDDAAAAPKATAPPPAEPPAAARPPPATGTAAAAGQRRRRFLGDARPADPGAPPPSSRSLDGH